MPWDGDKMTHGCTDLQLASREQETWQAADWVDELLGDCVGDLSSSIE
jgi:hypothetical protein